MYLIFIRVWSWKWTFNLVKKISIQFQWKPFFWKKLIWQEIYECIIQTLLFSVRNCCHWIVLFSVPQFIRCPRSITLKQVINLWSDLLYTYCHYLTTTFTYLINFQALSFCSILVLPFVNIILVESVYIYIYIPKNFCTHIMLKTVLGFVLVL